MSVPTPTERVVTALESAGRDPRQRGAHWESLCPAHDDHRPSLRITTGSDDRALVKCQAGCALDDVLGALKLETKDLFVERPADDRPRITATYPYTDEAGTPLFEVVRFTPKDFRQRTPDGRGGWSWRLNGVRRVPYRLPELRAAGTAGGDVFVVEGEKDVDAVVREGEIATCSPGGAGKWRQEYADVFVGVAEAVIVVDRDVAGYRHARDVARSLAPVVDSVVIREPRHGKDVSDHLGGGLSLDDLAELTFDELEQLCADSPEPTVSAPAPAGDEFVIEPIDWTKFWASEVPEAEFVIEPLFAAGRQTAIFSTAKVGKSLLVLDMVAAAVTGRSVLGLPAQAPIRVVYVDMEMTEADLRERLSDLGYGPDDDLSGLAYFQLPSLPPLDREIGGEVLLAIVTAHCADLVVIDTMARVVVGEENAADTYRAFYRHTGLPLKTLGVALARLDHMGKDGGLGQRGSSAKADDIDVVFKLTATDTTHLSLTRTHTRVPWMPSEVMVVRHEEPHLHHVVAAEGWPAGTAQVADLLDMLEVPLDASGTTATKALRDTGEGRRKVLVLAALKFRRARS